MRSFRILPLLALALAACSSGAAETAQVERTDSAGVEIVRNPGADKVLDWSMEPRFTLGGADSGPESFFQLMPTFIDTDGAGNLYVLDGVNHRVIVFDSEGNHLRSIGRRGGGPGEIEMPAAMAVERDGTVNVFDITKMSLVRWRDDGEVLEMKRMDAPVFQGFAFWNEATVTSLPALSDRQGFVTERLISAVGSDTVEYARIERRMPEMIDFGCVGLSLPPLFTPSLRWSVDADRLAYTSDVAYAFTVREGDQLRSVRREVVPRAVTREMALAEVGEEQEIRFFGGASPCKISGERMVEGQGFATHLPAIATISLSPTGEIWVRRGKVQSEPDVIDVFDETGAYLGTMPEDTPFPAGWTPDGQLIAIESDELDVQRLVVYQVIRSG